MTETEHGTTIFLLKCNYQSHGYTVLAIASQVGMFCTEYCYQKFVDSWGAGGAGRALISKRNLRVPCRNIIQYSMLKPPKLYFLQ